MLNESNRTIVEETLGRPLTAEEEVGFASLDGLPPDVLAAARKLRARGNNVVVSVYVRHVVPSATLIEIIDFVDALPREEAPDSARNGERNRRVAAR